MALDVVEVQDVCSGVMAAAGPARKVRGCLIARSAQGIYTVTIDPNNLAGPNLPAAESVSKVQVIGTDDELNAELVHTSDNVKTVTIRDSADVDQDSDFSVRLSRLLG